MKNLRLLLAGTAVLALALTLGACGQSQDTGPATLEVACVPPAEIWIDGTSHGTTPQKLSLDAGEHSVVLKRELFDSHEAKVDLKAGQTATVDASLMGSDPGDPEVIRILDEFAEIEQDVFEEEERHRGPPGNEKAVLLWPKKDVRKDGLTVFGIEVSMDYMGDGFLEFKKGRTVLYREPFVAEKIWTVAAIPASVQEAVKSGDTITWGSVFDRKRDNVTTKFKVVKGRSAVTALEKLERRKFYQRQPPLTQALMRAQVLHTKRLYTESLLANLAVTQAFPTSTQPYLGIVTALRRMDGKDSELWTAASQFAQGGVTSRLRKQARPVKNLPGGAAPLGNWHPGSSPVRGEPAVTSHDAAPHPTQPGPDGVTPPTQPQPTPTDPATQTPPATGPDTAALRDAARRLEDDLREPRLEAERARRQADEALDGARRAAGAAEAAAKTLRDAEKAHSDAEAAHLADPTPENHEALVRAQQALEQQAQQAAQTREDANRARADADKAAAEAKRREREIRDRERALRDLNDQIAQAGDAPGEPPRGNRRGADPTVQPDPSGPGAGRRAKRDAALRSSHTETRTRYQDGQSELGAARTRLGDLEARALEMLKAQDVTKDPVIDDAYNELLNEINEAQTELQQHEAEAQKRAKQYLQSLRGLGAGNPRAGDLATRVAENEAAVAVARGAVEQAEEAFRQDTSDTAHMEELGKARERLKEAEAALAETLQLYEAAIGDGD